MIIRASVIFVITTYGWNVFDIDGREFKGIRNGCTIWSFTYQRMCDGLKMDYLVTFSTFYFTKYNGLLVTRKIVLKYMVEWTISMYISL